MRIDQSAFVGMASSRPSGTTFFRSGEAATLYMRVEPGAGEFTIPVGSVAAVNVNTGAVTVFADTAVTFREFQAVPVG